MSKIEMKKVPKEFLEMNLPRGKKGTVVYFYPKDDTPGCTQEACEFQSNLSTIRKLGFEVVGVSKDSQSSHDKFKKKYSLKFPLISDESLELIKAFDVWKKKMNYGKTYMGIERSTFIVDNDGNILDAFSKVKVNGHVDEVLESLKKVD